MGKDTEELQELTEKQYNFVLGIQKGLTKSDAYRQAYDVSNMKTETVHRLASVEASKEKVRAWLEVTRREAINRLTDETEYNLKAHMAELNDLIEVAKANGSFGPALNGIIAKGKACNHYTEHKEINVNNAADLQLLDKLEALLGHDAMVSAAQQMGYKPEELERKH